MGYFEVFAAALAGFYALVPSYGLAIILLTLATRLLLLPLSIKQTRSMREMARIGPEVSKLRAKYKGDRQKMNEELMALYKEHGVNPFGGCAPLLLQMPVLFGLFYVIRQPLKYMGYKAVEVGGGALNFEPQAVEGFLGRIKGSALADGLFNDPLTVHGFLGLRLDCSSSLALRGQGTPILDQVCGTGLLSALPYILLVLAMGFTTYYQQKQMQATQQVQAAASPQMQQTQMMMTKFLPVMLMVFSFSFPSGLVVYWLATNLWTIVQQRIILRAVPLEATGPAAKKTGVGGNGAKKGTPKLAAKNPPSGTRGNSKKRPTGSSGPAAKKPAAATPAPRPSSKKKKKR